MSLAARLAAPGVVILAMIAAVLPGATPVTPAHAAPHEPAGPAGLAAAGVPAGIALPVLVRGSLDDADDPNTDAIGAPGLLVRAEAGLERRAAEVARRAPAQLAKIKEDLEGLPVPRRIELRLVRRAEDIARAAPPGRGAPRWASGVAYPDLGIAIVAMHRGPDAIDVDRTVTHELAHLALGAALGGRAPRWLDEGFAYLHSSDWSLARARTLAGMAWTGDVTPLWAIDARFPDRESEVDAAYAQSYDFVAFLARRGRYRDSRDDGSRYALREFLSRIAGGATVDQASWRAYGAGIDDLFDEWVVDLKERYLLLPIGLVGFGIWVVAAFLLVIGYVRRRRQNRVRLAQWEAEEAAAGAE